MKDKKSILVSETTHRKLKLYCESKGQKIGFGTSFILDNYLSNIENISYVDRPLKEKLTEKSIMINAYTHSQLKNYCVKYGKKMGLVIDFIINEHISKNKKQ